MRPRTVITRVPRGARIRAPANRSHPPPAYGVGRRKRIALRHRDREAAKAKAEEVAMALRRQEPPRVAQHRTVNHRDQTMGEWLEAPPAAAGLG